MKVKLLFIAFVCASQSLLAQDFLRVDSARYAFVGQPEKAFKVEVSRVERKEFIEYWEKQLKKNSDYDPQVSETGIEIKKVILPEVTKRPFDVYMHFEDMENGTRVYVGVQDSAQGFLNQNDPINGISLTNYIKHHTTEVFISAKKDDIDDEEDVLDDLEKELKSATKDKEHISKDIMKNEREIEKLKQEISFNTSLLETLQKRVTDRKFAYSALPNTADKDERKAAKKAWKSAENEYEETQKTIDKSTEDVFDLEADNREENEKLKRAEQLIEELTGKVETQRNKVKKLKEEVSAIEK